jgi:hypothetical protein
VLDVTGPAWLRFTFGDPVSTRWLKLRYYRSSHTRIAIAKKTCVSPFSGPEALYPRTAPSHTRLQKNIFEPAPLIINDLQKLSYEHFYSSAAASLSLTNG